MEESQEMIKRKTSIGIYSDTFEYLDKLREIYEDGTKESWDYFLKKIAKFYENKQEASA